MAGAEVLDGREIARRMKERLDGELRQLGATPQLRILYFDTPASKVYWKAQEFEACSLGIRTSKERPASGDPKTASYMAPWSATQRHVEDIIQQWDQDPDVHGIFVHQPLPPGIDAQRVSALIDPNKDVEGIHPQNSARRFFAKARIGSCTALAVMALIEETGQPLEGKEAVVIGHSEIVGRPVSMLLLDKLATTTVCHIGTDRAGHLEGHVRRAEVLVVAVGRPRFIPGAWIREQATVIDVGINVEGGRVVGDVEFEKAAKRAAYISPVPGGVGPVTVMMVMKNTVEAFKVQRNQRA